MEITTLGIDLAKDVFQLHGNNAKGRCVLRRKVRRGQLMAFLGTLRPITIAMEACSGSHWLARKVMALGHTALLIPPQFVKPFVKSNKSDAADAEAICEAATRPSMHFVAVKGAWHLDTQAIHRVRSCRVARRTAIANEIRAICTESGIVFAKGINLVRRLVPGLVADETNELSQGSRDLVRDLFSELLEVDKRVESMTAKLEAFVAHNEACQRLLKVGGIGVMTASAVVAACPDPAHFRNGRHFAAWLGLVPRHSGTGGRNVVGSISKRGDPYIRTLLIHGARSVVRRLEVTKDPRAKWLSGVKERRGYNKATVALANKNARIVWALLRREEDYRAA